LGITKKQVDCVYLNIVFSNIVYTFALENLRSECQITALFNFVQISSIHLLFLVIHFFIFSCQLVRNFISSSDWYNFAVPTPFYHLNIAEELLEHLGLPPAITDLINTYRFTFLFGNVAPDVQVISGQTRESTHFYILPTKADDLPPWERMLNTFSSIVFVDDIDLE